MPFVLFKTILDLDPNHENPTLREDRPDLEARGDRPAGLGPGDQVDVRPSRHRAESHRLRRRRGAAGRPSASRRCRSDSRSKTRDRSSRCRQLERRPRDAQLRLKSVFQNTSLLIAKLKTADQEENWETDRPGFGSPGIDGSRVLLVRGLPRRARGGRREDEVPSRHAQHRDRSAVLLEAADADRAPRSSSRASTRHRRRRSTPRRSRQTRAPSGRCTPRCWTRRATAGDAVRIVAVADRAREDSDACGRRQVSRGHEGSHRRRGQDPLHLLRRRQEQRLQEAASRRARRSAGADGCVRHRLGPGRDSHAAAGQQLPEFVQRDNPKSPIFTGLLEGEWPAGRHCRHDRRR